MRHTHAPVRIPVIALVLVASMIAGCGRSAGRAVGPVHGVVVSAGSGRALAGAQVLVEWHARVDAFAANPVAIIRTCTTRSAADGTFSAPEWRAPRFVTGAVVARVFVFLDGYGTRPRDTGIDHPGSEPVAHPMFETGPGEIPASGDLRSKQTRDCAETPVFALPHAAA